MRVKRTIAMNPVEPAPMSLRIPNGVPLTLDIQYLDVQGRPLTEDLAAQLQVTSRTRGNTDFYAVPATDIINGKARLTIAENILKDMNGYRIRLAGTWKGEAALIALGTIRIVEAAGLQATPEDVIDDVPLYLAYNFDAGISIRLWQDAAKSAPFNLDTATVTAAIYATRTETTPLVAFTVTRTAIPGEVMLGLTHDQVNALPAGCWWSLRASTAGGVITLCQGTVTITGVRPPP